MNSPIYFNVIYFEEWRPITDKSIPNIKQGQYYISNLGRAWSTARNCFLKPVQTWNGYWRIALARNDGTHRYFLIHRIVMIEFYPIYNYQNMQVNHKNGDKFCNDIGNLEWMTGSENIKHAFDTGLKTQRHGEDASNAVITNDQANQIGSMLQSQQYSHKEIAEISGAPLYIVDNISSGTTWKDIYNKYELYNRPKKNKLSTFTDGQLIQVCEYFETHCGEYKVRTDLFRHMMMDLFGMEYERGMDATLNRIYNHQTRRDIVDRYNFERSQTIES